MAGLRDPDLQGSRDKIRTGGSSKQRRRVEYETHCGGMEEGELSILGAFLGLSVRCV